MLEGRLTRVRKALEGLNTNRSDERGDSHVKLFGAYETETPEKRLRKVFSHVHTHTLSMSQCNAS